MRNPDWNDNGIIRGYFRNFDGLNLNATTQIKAILADTDTTTNRAVTGPTFDKNQPLKDNSLVGACGRRFEGGGIRLFNPPVEFSRPNVNGVVSTPPSLVSGNFSSTITLTTPSNLVNFAGGQLMCTIFSSATDTINLTFSVSNISQVSTSENFMVHSSTPLPGLSTFSGGKISLGGGPVMPNAIVNVDTSGLFFTITDSAFVIPIEIRDDDDIPLVGRSVDIDSVNINLGLMDSIYNSVYVDVKLDGGGNILNNERDISFYKNIDSETLMPSGTIIPADIYSYHLDSLRTRFQGRLSSGRNYWVVHLVSSWQASTKDDADCQAEGATVGIAIGATVHDCSIAKGGKSVLVFHASVREAAAAGLASDISYSTCHEIGHCFGLSHGNAYNSTSHLVASCIIPPSSTINLNMMGLMTGGALSTGATNIIPYHQNIIRSRILSPGE
jgi:hypothetical protein